jgi:mono/diheme cytochrome c family protein
MKRTNKLFALAATFNSPNEIIHAAKVIAEAGYKNFDMNTPYPVHGMDKAMKLKPSKLGLITLAFGLSGAAFAMFFMWWAMSVDYPQIIGGKPFFAFPAFIPVAFEVTVLFATLSTVIGLLTFMFGFPNNKHSLHDTEYMKKVSADKFGAVIYADDSLFNESKIKELFNSLKASSVESIYHYEKISYPIFEPKFLMFLLAIAVVTSGGTYFTLNKLLFMEPFSWMAYQDKTTAQEKSAFFEDGFGGRTKIEGTVARGFIPYPYMGQTNPTETLANPLLPTKENLAFGQIKYLTFCSPCHGNYADGDSRLRGQFPNPPTLHSTRARDFSDGMIYHIITNGQNVMPSYVSQIPNLERWAIVNYVRVLQRAKNAKDSDIEQIQKGLINAAQ